MLANFRYIIGLKGFVCKRWLSCSNGVSFTTHSCPMFYILDDYY